MAHVMVLDDEPSICWAFRNFLGDDGHRVSVAADAERGLARIEADPPDLLFLDVRLPGMDGLATLGELRRIRPGLPVVVMTAHGTIETAVGAVRGGAFEYLPKPFDISQARALVRRALASVRAETGPETGRPVEDGGLVGRSLPLQRVFRQIAMAASQDEPVLITGESGTGKELVARAIHRYGDRANGPFVPVHLAALPEGLIERELFGHERGAFTGAEAARPGLFDRAIGGTIFFDEVAEAPLAIQAKLLRVLDGHEYRSVGGGSDKTLRARVVAATNRDLAGWARSGQFRADLFYRLAVVPIVLPPLRDRRDDILPLWDHFVARASLRPIGPVDPSSPLAARLLDHAWPGNVRELRNAAEGFARDPDVLPDLVTPDDPTPGSTSDVLDAAVRRWVADRLEGADPTTLHADLIRDVEGPLLRALVASAGGNQVRMARLLGLHRTTLRQKLRRHQLDPREE